MSLVVELIELIDRHNPALTGHDVFHGMPHDTQPQHLWQWHPQTNQWQWHCHLETGNKLHFQPSQILNLVRLFSSYFVIFMYKSYTRMSSLGPSGYNSSE